MPGGTEDALEVAQDGAGAWHRIRDLLLCLELFQVPEPSRWEKATLCHPGRSWHPGHAAWAQPPSGLSMAQGAQEPAGATGLQVSNLGQTWAGGMGSWDCDSSPLAQALGTLGGAWSEETSFTEVSRGLTKTSSMTSCAVQVNKLVVRFLVQHVNNSYLGDRLFKYHY